MVAQKVRIWLIAFIAITSLVACGNVLTKNNVTITFGKTNLRFTAGGDDSIPDIVPIYSETDIRNSTVGTWQAGGMGTGVCIGTGKILTAYHCTNKAGPVWIVHGGKHHVAQVECCNSLTDLAVLTFTPTDPITPLKIAKHDPKTGEKVTSVGWADTQSTTLWSMTDTGPIAGFQRTVDRPLVMGRSGGAIVNNRNEIIGITTSSTPTNGYYTDLASIRLLLGSNY